MSAPITNDTDMFNWPSGLMGLRIDGLNELVERPSTRARLPGMYIPKIPSHTSRPNSLPRNAKCQAVKDIKAQPYTTKKVSTQNDIPKINIIAI